MFSFFNNFNIIPSWKAFETYYDRVNIFKTRPKVYRFGLRDIPKETKEKRKEKKGKKKREKKEKKEKKEEKGERREERGERREERRKGGERR